MFQDFIKKIILCAFLFISSQEIVFGQDFSFPMSASEDPVQWTPSIVKENDSIYVISLIGTIEKDWHLYSQYSPEGGSQPAIFKYENQNNSFLLLGTTEESQTYGEYSDVFNVTELFFKDSVIFKQRLEIKDRGLSEISFSIDYQVCKEVCIPNMVRFTVALETGKEVSSQAAVINNGDQEKTTALLLNLKSKDRLGSLVPKETAGGVNGWWKIFLLGMLGGFIALLTPCVFPMIPLTVSFFTKSSDDKKKGITNALWYGFFIVLIYVLLSLPFHLFNSLDAQILNTIATNIWLNLLFFVIFIFFAGSFFGFYELNLPASWSNKIDASASRIGGVVGVFFMALTLALVSFSCTGPILGGLLGSTTLAGGDVATNLTVGMFGFGLALALPFALFALFPGLLSGLPKSGGWMITVKVFLGFLELGLAFKFLSNADLVGHWGILKREIFLGIWLLLSIGLAAYLLGVFDKMKKPIHWSRFPWIAGCIVFGSFLLLGIFKKQNLAWLSGFPPPSFYSVYAQESDCPLGLNCYKDFETGWRVAQEENKPILLDFTGWACVNCRRMEENVWSDPSVFTLINEEFVLISLYVDDRKELPHSDQFVFTYPSGRQKPIETIGQKWGTFQTVNFNAASQPYYVLLSPSLEVLAPAIQYTDIPTYKKWLLGALNR